MQHGFNPEPLPDSCAWCGVVAFAFVVAVWIVGYVVLAPYM